MNLNINNGSFLHLAFFFGAAAFVVLGTPRGQEVLVALRGAADQGLVAAEEEVPVLLLTAFAEGEWRSEEVLLVIYVDWVSPLSICLIRWRPLPDLVQSRQLVPSVGNPGAYSPQLGAPLRSQEILNMVVLLQVPDPYHEEEPHVLSLIHISEPTRPY